MQEWNSGMVKTLALTKVMDKLNSGVTWVTIKGQPGEGKTTAAFMALEELQRSGREVFQVISPEEFTEVITTCNKPVIMLDDILGNLEFDREAWSRWKPVINGILEDRVHQLHGKKLTEKEVTVIFVSRNYVLNNVFNEIGKVVRYFIDDNNVVFMSNSEERAFSEKVSILKAICESRDFPLDAATIHNICTARGPHGFPHTCRLFITLRLEDAKIDTVKFMEAPLTFLNQTVQKFLDDRTKRLLFKEMIKRDGKITDRDIEELTDSYDVKTLADSLVDSYLRKEDDCYTFHHPSIYDSIAFNLTKYFPSFVIKHCSLSFLHERLRLETSPDKQNTTSSSKFDLIVNISRCYIKDLAKRFAAEMEHKNLMLILSHNALTDQLFIQELMCHATLPLTELLKLTDKETQKSFLSLLASNKSPQLLKYIDNQIDLQLTKRDIDTVLYGVCMYAASDVLTYLDQTRSTLDIDVRYEDDKTPLMIASGSRDSLFVQQLMSLAPDLNARDSDHQTVLHHFCINGMETALEQAIDRGADIDVKTKRGHSPLLYACAYNQAKVARLLLDIGVRFTDKTVMEACRSGGLDVVKLLYHRGATVDMDTYIDTPLSAASYGGNVEVMKFLVDKGASFSPPPHGDSPLHRACCNNKHQAVQWLLTHGAYKDMKNQQGFTPLHSAAYNGHIECVVVLLKAGSDVNAKSTTDETPLHYATRMRSKECVDVLVNAGATIDTRDREGQTPLHKAVFYRYNADSVCLPDIAVLQTLINHGAVINKKDTGGNTPLHLLCQVDSHTEIYKQILIHRDLYKSLVTLLIDQGADREIKNNRGEPALHGWCKTLTNSE